MKQNFKKSETGIAAIEMAIILPFLILLVIGSIELGLYFISRQIVERAVNSTAIAIQKDPLDPANWNYALNSGMGPINFSDVLNNDSFICAMTYTSVTGAKQSNACSLGQWWTSRPDSLADNAPYYIAVRGYVKYRSLTGLANKFIPNINVVTAVKISSEFDLSELSGCTGQGKKVEFSNNKLRCVQTMVESDFAQRKVTNHGSKGSDNEKFFDPKCRNGSDGKSISPDSVLIATKWLAEGWLTLGQTSIGKSLNNNEFIGGTAYGVNVEGARYDWVALEADGKLRERFYNNDSTGGGFTYDIIKCRKYRWE